MRAVWHVVGATIGIVAGIFVVMTISVFTENPWVLLALTFALSGVCAWVSTRRPALLGVMFGLGVSSLTWGVVAALLATES